MEQHRLFVYGTLRKNGSANFLMKRARLLFENVQLPGVKIFDQGDYPIALNGFDQQCRVTGDIYALGEDMLQDLDHYEGGEYYRKRVEPFHCWIYLGKTSDWVKQLPEIKSGDWLKHIR